jgi:hypothetical protein
LASDGAANSPVTVPVTLNVAPAAVQLSQIGAFSHIAAGAGWDTTITLMNLGNSSAVTRLRFWDDNGAPLLLLITADTNTPPVTMTSFDQTLSPGASITVALQTGSGAMATGWAELDAPLGATMGGFAIFQYQSSGMSSEGSSPLVTSPSTTLIIPYDNTTFTTGIALANQSDSAPINLSVKILDRNGMTTVTDSLSVAPNGHTAFSVSGKYPPTAGRRGIIELHSQSTAAISAVALRFSPAGTFTSVPVTFR